MVISIICSFSHIFFIIDRVLVLPESCSVLSAANKPAVMASGLFANANGLCKWPAAQNLANSICQAYSLEIGLEHGLSV